MTKQEIHTAIMEVVAKVEGGKLSYTVELELNTYLSQLVHLHALQR